MGDEDQGNGAFRVGALSDGLRLGAPAIAEPFVRGQSIRILRLGTFTVAYRYEAADWRRNVGDYVVVTRIAAPVGILEDAGTIFDALDLGTGAVDNQVSDERVAALEINFLPGVPDDPEAEHAFASMVASVAATWFE